MTTLPQLYCETQFPAFQNKMYPTRDAALNCVKGDIRICQDSESGLINNAAFDPSVVEYGSDYQNEQGVSPSFLVHLDEVTTIVREHLLERSIIEIGCGKGFFLNILRNAGVDVIGFDPTYEGEDPKIVKEYFSERVGVSGRNIVLRHVLEHIPDPFAFLKAVRDINRGGLIYIEVPCVEWIRANNAWFDIFYEHVNYFRLQDFHRMFGRVLKSDHFFGGQYIYVVADLASLRAPVRPDDDVFEFRTDLLKTIVDFSHILKSSAENTGAEAAVWGGASKGVIFSLLMQRRNTPPSFAVDLNPAKQGKFMAASGIEIVSPDAANARLPEGAPVFVMNNNYLEEIKSMSNARFNYLTVTQ